MYFNGVKKKYLTVLRGRKRPAWAQVDRNMLTIDSMPGAYLSGTRTHPRSITVPVLIQSDTFSNLQKLKEDMAEWLIHDEAKPLIFADELDRVYYAVVDGDLDLDELVRWGEGEITFLCPDPYKYSSSSQSLIFPADTVKIDNKGTVEADPVFELTAKKKTTFAMISNGDEVYNLVGKPADVDEQLVNEKTLIFDERGDTLSGWTSAGTATDNGKVTGSLVADGTGIVIQSYGSTDKNEWQGPALMKEITPVQDFEIEMRCRADTTKPNQSYRIECYLYDEHMKVLGKIAIVNRSIARIQFVAEGRYGPYLGNGIHYPIYSANYLKLEKQFHGMVRMRRIGKRFEFYVARMGISTSGKHYDTLTKVYNDVANEYQGKLKYVQIHIGKYRGTSNANLPRINAIKVYKHTSAKVDQTPYILDVGDVVTLDHKTKDILLNGESRKDLKNFGGSFFKLKKGENMLLVSPEDTFETRAIFQERFL